jgi:hypothetical protein
MLVNTKGNSKHDQRIIQKETSNSHNVYEESISKTKEQENRKETSATRADNIQQNNIKKNNQNKDEYTNNKHKEGCKTTSSTKLVEKKEISHKVKCNEIKNNIKTINIQNNDQLCKTNKDNPGNKRHNSTYINSNIVKDHSAIASTCLSNNIEQIETKTINNIHVNKSFGTIPFPEYK